MSTISKCIGLFILAVNFKALAFGTHEAYHKSTYTKKSANKVYDGQGDLGGIENGDNSGTPKQNIPLNEPPYATLKKSFDDSHDPINIIDIDDEVAGSNQSCAWATADYTKPAAFYLKKTQWEVFTPGKPGNGPLFPGTPDRNELHTAFLAYSYLNVQIQQLRNYITVDQTATELHSTIAYYPGINGTPAETWVRKNGDLITTLTITSSGSRNEQYYYGYCWRN